MEFGILIYMHVPFKRSMNAVDTVTDVKHFLPMSPVSPIRSSARTVLGYKEVDQLFGDDDDDFVERSNKIRNRVPTPRFRPISRDRRPLADLEVHWDQQGQDQECTPEGELSREQEMLLTQFLSQRDLHGFNEDYIQDMLLNYIRVSGGYNDNGTRGPFVPVVPNLEKSTVDASKESNNALETLRNYLYDKIWMLIPYANSLISSPTDTLSYVPFFFLSKFFFLFRFVLRLKAKNR